MPAKLGVDVWNERILNASNGRFEFIGWDESKPTGIDGAVKLRCNKDGHEWVARVRVIAFSGGGCPLCAGKHKWTREEREDQISRIKNIEFLGWHGEYSGSFSRALLKCKVDGHIWDTNIGALINSKTGCPKCGHVTSGVKQRVSTKDREDSINKRHDVKFVSWPKPYKSALSKVTVLCCKCNREWTATLNNVINGTGCPRCAVRGFKATDVAYIYHLVSDCGKYTKVGITGNVKDRFRDLKRYTPFKFSVVKFAIGDGIGVVIAESEIHKKHTGCGFSGFNGCSEWINSSEELNLDIDIAFSKFKIGS